MILALSILIAILLVAVIMRFANPYPFHDSFDDVEEVHTTTTTTVTHDNGVQSYPTVGNLMRLRETNGQFYVIDPVDHDKVYINDSDDLYEDGAGKIWNLT